jgi:tripartite-type tricarboxylate transporter receptor subunit TctC
MSTLSGRLAALAGGALLAAAACGVSAQSWPERPVRIVIADAPGGGSDLAGRLLAVRLQQRLGQPFVIDNKPGAGGVLGTMVAKNAAPDGYTYVIGTAGSHGINAAVYAKLSYHPLRDFEPVAMINKAPNVCVVNADLPARTLKDLVSLAKASPGKLNFASGGNGTSAHFTGEYLKMVAGIDMVHVPYKGAAPAVQAVAAGEVQVFCGNLPPTMGLIKAGKVRPLAVTTLSRNRELPEVPTVAESGYPGFETVAWFGFFAPKGTPQAIVEKFAQELGEVIRAPDIRDGLIAQGSDPIGNSPAQFRIYVEDEIVKWTQVARTANVRLD